jgi:hypothetical protein
VEWTTHYFLVVVLFELLGFGCLPIFGGIIQLFLLAKYCCRELLNVHRVVGIIVVRIVLWLLSPDMH